MRFRGRTILAAFIAAFALAAVGAASASANAPEFAPKAGESFPTSIGNTMHAGNVTFAWTSMTWGTCTENKTEGSITGPKTVSLTLEWAGCSSRWHTEGSPEGHIVITGTGTLSYITRSPEKVGVVLAIKEVKIFSESTYIKLRGSLVIPITPLRTETSKFALPIHTISLGEQEFGSYENEDRKAVEARPTIEFGTSFKKAGIEVQGGNELTTNKPLTINTPAPPPLPEFILGAGEAYPVALEGAAPFAEVTLASAAGLITCEGANNKGTITGSTSLSTLTYELQHCKKGATECATGAEAGTVTLTGSASLHYISKAEERVALVFALNEAKITCGAATIKVRGSLVTRVTPIGLKTTHPVLALTRNGEAYENTYTTYENEKGEVITAKIEPNFGTGFKKGVLATGGLQLTANKALTIEG